MKLRIDWDKQGYEGVVESTIKKYNAMIHTQSAVHCMVELVRQNRAGLSVAEGFNPGQVASIAAEVTQMTYDFAGGGLYGVDKEVRIKEQADHNLSYLLAVALLDGNVMPAQFTPERINRSDVQALLKKVSAKPNQAYTEQYPRRMPAKITVRLQDGTIFEHEVEDYPGLPCHPFTWEDSVEKFDQLVTGRIDDYLSEDIKDAVRSLENIRVKDLTKLLDHVQAS
jgi:2-methylcitrate dehydratase